MIKILLILNPIDLMGLLLICFIVIPFILLTFLAVWGCTRMLKRMI